VADGGRTGRCATACWIFDRWLPADAPSRPALANRAARRRRGFRNGGADERIAALVHARHASGRRRRRSADRGHRHAARVQGRRLVAGRDSDRGLPLVSVSDARDRRFIVLGFGIGEIESRDGAGVFRCSSATHSNGWAGRPYGILQRVGAGRAAGQHRARRARPNGAAVPLTREGGRVVRAVAEPGLYQVDAGGSRGASSA
jgi:hypothetical protein